MLSVVLWALEWPYLDQAVVADSAWQTKDAIQFLYFKYIVPSDKNINNTFAYGDVCEAGLSDLELLFSGNTVSYTHTSVCVVYFIRPCVSMISLQQKVVNKVNQTPLYPSGGTVIPCGAHAHTNRLNDRKVSGLEFIPCCTGAPYRLNILSNFKVQHQSIYTVHVEISLREIELVFLCGLLCSQHSWRDGTQLWRDITHSFFYRFTLLFLPFKGCFEMQNTVTGTQPCRNLLPFSLKTYLLILQYKTGMWILCTVWHF